ncbi:MAG TPA: hypothetical protein VHQ41_03200 [Patescibacteria group bacterium]|jgi:hypothetical protein|nr:hypothetical protein [Patescibacteria group bacterium]
MTVASFLIGTTAFQIIFVLLKIFFINSLDLDNNAVMGLFFVLIVVAAIATVRRLGILNYLESFFLSVSWLLLTLIVDVIVVAHFTGYDIYKAWYYWLTYLAMILAIIIFHKKAHVEVRKANK